MTEPQKFSLGGDSMPSAKFEKAGDSITGTVVDLTERQSTKLGTTELDFWPDGKPKLYYRLVLQTALREEANDDGRRSVALTGSRKTSEQSSLSSVLDAVTAATGSSDIMAGATVTVTMTGQVAPKTAGYNPRKTFSASYVPPAMSLTRMAPAEPVAAAPVQAAPAIASAQGQQTNVASAAGAAQQFSAEQIEAMRAAGVDVSKFVTV